MSTLYERLGGEPAMQAAVEAFYRRMLTDDRVSGFFDDVDMEGQIAKQKAFLTMACGGPASYSGRELAEAHRPLLAKGLADEHVDVVIEHLGATLVDLGVEAALVSEAAALLETTRDDVLDRRESA